jgi:hypothetical protein
MHDRLQTIIDVLDGKPRGVRGQSLMEMTLTIPILILMILSLAEVGFVANNYLTLMDLVRESGRRGANLNPTLWNENQTRNYERLDCDNVAGVYNFDNSLQAQATPRREARGPSAAFGYSNVYDNPANPEDPPFGFFDAVVCQGAFSMAPLEFEDQDWGLDGLTEPPRANLFRQNEIVVSAFAYTRMDYRATDENGTFILDQSKLGASVPPTTGVWITVTGRYPMANRFCRAADGTGDARDPFDFQRSEFYTDWHNGASVPDPNEINDVNDPYRLTDTSQQVRGFVFTGQAVNENGCLGSRFTVQDIEQRLNQDLATEALAEKVPNGGLVLVEYSWQHHPLFLGPLFQGFVAGDVSRDPVLYLFGVFPTLGAQPTATPDS